jgi:hypothetical protein
MPACLPALDGTFLAIIGKLNRRLSFSVSGLTATVTVFSLRLELTFQGGIER